MTRDDPRHDRTGDQLDDDPPPDHDPRCHNGWIDYDNAIPCLVCKHWLHPDVRRRQLLDADQLRTQEQP